MSRTQTHTAFLTHRLSVIRAEMTHRQFLWGQSTEMKSLKKNLMRLRDGKTGSDETGLFVQQIGTTRGVTDTQWRG